MTNPGNSARKRAWAAQKRRKEEERRERKKQNLQALDLIPPVQRGVTLVDTPAEYETERGE